MQQSEEIFHAGYPWCLCPQWGVASQITQDAIHMGCWFAFATCYVMECRVDKRSRALALL
jgi:hypothetical protein